MEAAIEPGRGLRRSREVILSLKDLWTSASRSSVAVSSFGSSTNSSTCFKHSSATRVEMPVPVCVKNDMTSLALSMGTKRPKSFVPILKARIETAFCGIESAPSGR